MLHESKNIDFREKQVQQFVESQRPPQEIRDQLDLGYEWQDSAFVLFEIRPDYKDPKRKHHFPFAKARFIKSKKVWKIYWMRANQKWEAYPPQPEVDRLDQVLKIIDEDKSHCFKG